MINMDLIKAWYIAKQRKEAAFIEVYGPLEAEEKALRQQVSAMFEQRGGVQRIDIGGGCRLVGKFTETVAVDDSLTDDAIEQLRVAGIPVDTILTKKYTLNKRAYGNMDPSNQEMVDRFLTLKLGSFSLDLEKDKEA